MSPRWCPTRRGLRPRCAACAFPAARSSWSTISPARTGRLRFMEKRLAHLARHIGFHADFPFEHLPARQPPVDPRGTAEQPVRLLETAALRQRKAGVDPRLRIPHPPVPAGRVPPLPQCGRGCRGSALSEGLAGRVPGGPAFFGKARQSLGRFRRVAAGRSLRDDAFGEGRLSPPRSWAVSTASAMSSLVMAAACGAAISSSSTIAPRRLRAASAGQSAWTRPMRKASAASKRSPVSARRLTIRGRGGRPRAE